MNKFVPNAFTQNKVVRALVGLPFVIAWALVTYVALSMLMIMVDLVVRYG